MDVFCKIIIRIPGPINGHSRDKVMRTDISLSAEKAFEVFKALCEAGEPCNLASLVRATGYPRTVTLRMAATLEHCGFVERNHKSGLYTVSPMVLHQVQKGVANNPYFTRIDLIMREVVERTGDAAIHMVRKGDQALVMSRREGSSRLRVLAAEAGMEVPLHCGGAPLALLAFSSDAFIEDYLSTPLEKRTSSTITNPEKLRELIAEFRERRYTVGNGDLFQYFVAVGVPVYDSSGELIGAISVGDIAQKYPPERIREVGRILVEITSRY